MSTNTIREYILDKHGLTFVGGNAEFVSYVTKEDFRSELIGLMLRYPNRCNFSPDNNIAFYYPRVVTLLKEDISIPVTEEEKIAADLYELLKEEYEKGGEI